MEFGAESDENITLNRQTAKHLWSIANNLATACPAASRFYLFNLERKFTVLPELKKLDFKWSFLYCHHCGNLWAPGNYRVRIKPCPKPNCHIKKLILCEKDEPWKLNNRQKRKLRKFRASTSKIVYTCFSCKKKTEFPGTKTVSENQTVNASSAISTPNIKSRKGDLNAGLFIPASCIKPTIEINRKLEDMLVEDSTDETPSVNLSHACESEPSVMSPSSSSMTRSVDKTMKSHLKHTLQTPCMNYKMKRKASVSSSGKACRKKSKSLLGQILSKEKEQKPKKCSLLSLLLPA